jgi:hypothetical protein
MSPKHEWLLRLALSVIGLIMLLNTSMRRGWIR